MERVTFYDKKRNRHIIKVVDGEQSLQMSFTPREFRDMTAVELSNNFKFLENKLEFAISLGRKH